MIALGDSAVKYDHDPIGSSILKCASLFTFPAEKIVSSHYI